jgi:hypothetical protein
MFHVNDAPTNGKRYSWEKQAIFLLGFIIFAPFFSLYHAINTIIAWATTLQAHISHSESTSKISVDPKLK